MANTPSRKRKDSNNGEIYCIRNDVDKQYRLEANCVKEWHITDKMPKKQNRQNTLLYLLMLKYGIEHFIIEPIEEYPCENSNQLERREGELTRKLKASPNKVVAGRTMDEYNVEWAEKIKASKAIRDKRYAENIPEKK